MTAEPLRRQARHLYQLSGGSVRLVARRLGLSPGAARALLLRGVEPGEEHQRRQPTRAPQAGCGCTERKLCAVHQAMLDEMRAR